MPQFIKVLEAESSGEYVKIMRYFSLPDITSILFLRRSIGLGWKPTVISCTKKATTRWILCEISRFRYFLGWDHALLRALISLLPCPPHPNHLAQRHRLPTLTKHQQRAGIMIEHHLEDWIIHEQTKGPLEDVLNIRISMMYVY